jgi:hypothetical protein
MPPDTRIQASTITGMPFNEGIYKNVNAFRFVLHNIQLFFTFFLFNNQPDAVIIQIYSVIKLYMFPSRVKMNPDSAWKRSSKPA